MLDARNQKVLMGASAAGGSTRDYAAFNKHGLGAQFEIINGYKGTTDIMLAMERGEVDGLCGLDWTSLKSQKPQWLRDKTVNILVQNGLQPEHELDALGVPMMWNFLLRESDRKPLELIVSQQVFGRPYVAPPGVPAKQVNLDIAPLPGEKVQETVAAIYAAPKEVVQRARELIVP
jgi:hypothetical protein